jgi:monoamine oxidase
MSWTTQDITQIWYPSHGIHGAKGVVLGAYVFGGAAAQRFEQLTPSQRQAAAIAQAAKVHPRYGEYVDNGISVVWRRIRYLQGCAPLWTAAGRSEFFATLRNAHGRHYMVGDQVSFASGWQQGAMDSAWAAVRDIDARVRAEIA